MSLPRRWKKLTLGELTSSTRPICYGVLKPGPFDSGGVPLVRIQDLKHGKVDKDGLHYITRELDREFARSRLVGGEVLLSIQGTIGRAALCPPDLAGANISRTVAVVDPDDRLNNTFLRYYFGYLAAIDAYETGGARGEA